MKSLNKIGFIILALVWPVSYYLKHINHLVSQLVVDYFITFGYCIGTTLLSIYYGKKEKDKVTKHLFFGTITILNISIVTTYLIDLLIDPVFGTTKVIWSILFASILGLCIYLFKRKY